MRRNLDRRFEVLWPVTDKKLQRRLIAALNTYFSDNVKAYRLLPDGTYERVWGGEEKIRAQEKLYYEAVEAARRGELFPSLSTLAPTRRILAPGGYRAGGRASEGRCLAVRPCPKSSDERCPVASLARGIQPVR